MTNKSKPYRQRRHDLRRKSSFQLGFYPGSDGFHLSNLSHVAIADSGKEEKTSVVPPSPRQVKPGPIRIKIL
eukprot:3172970-Pyramimonas_sp.AAC.1